MTTAADRLQAECQAVAARLEAAVTPEEQEQVRQAIARLVERAEAAAAAINAVRGDLHDLVERFHRRTTELAPRRREPQATRPVRADHLGASTFIEKGWSLIALGDHGGAVTALRKAMELAPEDRQAEALLGWALMLAEQYDDALAAFSRVLAAEPDNALARVNLGFVCFKKGIFGEAIEHLARVLREDRDRKAILYANYYLGLVYLERAMYADAQAFFRQALSLGPNLHEASYDLGRAQWLAGEKEAARATWHAAATAGSLSPWGRRAAELLATVDAGGEVPR
ncbi:MAG TPA: tetratricopeptide repeat protein [Gemmatimonadales bacterium]|nr:tetratricopeptide repeat protein [Gemmatimonadales bacterium]